MDALHFFDNKIMETQWRRMDFAGHGRHTSNMDAVLKFMDKELFTVSQQVITINLIIVALSGMSLMDYYFKPCFKLQCSTLEKPFFRTGATHAYILYIPLNIHN